MFRGDRKHLLNTEPVEIVNERGLFFGVNFVHRHEEWPVRLAQQTHEFKIRTREFGASIDNHNNGGGFFEGHAGLAINLRRDQILLFGKNAACIDDPQLATSPFCVSVETVTGDARFVSHDGTPRADDAIEECGLAHIGASYDCDCRNAGGGGGESACRIVSWLSQSWVRKFGIPFGDGRPRLPQVRDVPVHVAGNSYYRDSRGFEVSTRASSVADRRSQRQRRYASPILRPRWSPVAHARRLRI